MERIDSVKNDQKYITRTMLDGDPNTHKALVCVICDVILIGTESVCYLDKEQFLKHKHRIIVQRYIKHFGDPMDPLLVLEH